jgi:hydroxymethylbilane synthase
MERYYRVGTRASPLALKQVDEILCALRKFYPTFKAETVGIDTYGDKNRSIPISHIEGTDFFTREIDRALLVREIDFAIHSAKDLPDRLNRGLVVAALTETVDPYDVLVSKFGLKLDELPFGAKIGTSSLRRKSQLKKYRDDFRIVDIRGNVEERLNILDASDLDGIVIAAAGLIRLGLEDRITHRIPLEILKPHPLQGCLAVVARIEDSQMLNLLSVIDSREDVLV